MYIYIYQLFPSQGFDPMAPNLAVLAFSFAWQKLWMATCNGSVSTNQWAVEMLEVADVADVFPGLIQEVYSNW